MLEGKTVFVCGAGPGLGREVALAALREGARVALAARNESRLNSLAKELGAGDRVLVAPLDLTDAVAIESALARTEETFGRIDALVQVASLHVMGDVADTRADQWRDAYDTNVVGLYESERTTEEGEPSPAAGYVPEYIATRAHKPERA